MKKITTALLATLAIVSSGCAVADGGYTQASVGQVKSIKRGTILQAKNITIKDDYKGAVAGAIVGGVAGSAFGKGDGKVAATAAGALLGALAGDSLNKDAGQELTIKFDNGDIVTTVYRVDKNHPLMFRSGDRVELEMLNSEIKSIRLMD